MIVYADVLVALNLFVTYFLLLCTKGILRKRVRRRRLLFGSLFGGFYALIIFLPPMPKFATICMNLAASAVIVALAFPFQNFKDFLKCFAGFFLVNFVFAGLMLALWICFKPNGMVYQNGAVYFNIDLKTLVLSTCFCYVVLTLFENLLRRKAPDNCLFDIELQYGGKKVLTKALLDTGNSLSDGFSDTPVLVADSKVFKELIGISLNSMQLEKNNMDLFRDLSVRMIPYTSVSKGGVLKAVLIDKVIVLDKHEETEHILLAESLSPFENGEYSVLLNQNFFERSKNNATRKNKAIF